MSDGLKAGWRRVKFGEVVRLNKDTSKDPATEGLERYVGLEHIEPGDLRIRSWGEIAEGTTFTNRFRPGQVLFGKRRSYQSKVAVADFEGVCSGDIYVLESRDPGVLLPGLLPFICQTDAFLDHAVKTSAGSLSPRTNWTSLAGFEFALPPLDEQQRLAGIFAALDVAVASYQQAAQGAERSRRSYLLDLLRPDRGSSDGFPSHWKVAAAQSLGSIQLGQQRHPKFNNGSNMRPYLRVANVMDGSLKLDDVYQMHFPESQLGKFELRAGDILLNEGQDTDLVGRSAIYRGEIPGCCVQKTLLRFRCGPELLPGFAQAYFQHCLYSKKFARIAVQTTSIAHLTAAAFRRFTIPVPPLGEQQRIVEFMSALERAQAALLQRVDDARRAGKYLVDGFLVG